MLMASEPARPLSTPSQQRIMDDMLARIHGGIDELRSGLDEIKHEAIAAGSQLEALTRQVAITNGKVARHEDDIRALQNAELVRVTIEGEKAKNPAQPGDIVISKKMMGAVMGGTATLLFAITEAIRQYLAGN